MIRRGCGGVAPGGGCAGLGGGAVGWVGGGGAGGRGVEVVGS